MCRKMIKFFEVKDDDEIVEMVTYHWDFVPQEGMAVVFEDPPEGCEGIWFITSPPTVIGGEKGCMYQVNLSKDHPLDLLQRAAKEGKPYMRGS